MTRSFLRDPIPEVVLSRVLEQARHVPSAGNTQGFDFVVLEGDQTSIYWDVTLPRERRETFRWSNLLDAPSSLLYGRTLTHIWSDIAGAISRRPG